jgi:hypothetical protein
MQPLGPEAAAGPPQWVASLCAVVFDKDHGATVCAQWPPGALGAAEQQAIAFHALPVRAPGCPLRNAVGGARPGLSSRARPPTTAPSSCRPTAQDSMSFELRSNNSLRDRCGRGNAARRLHAGSG